MDSHFLASRSSLLKRIVYAAATTALFAGAVVTAGGCSDLVTFGEASREEGVAHYNAGAYPEAAGSFANAIKQRPQDYKSYYYLARTHEAMKNYNTAVGQYRTALTLMQTTLVGQEDKETRAKIIDGLASTLGKGNDAALEQSAFAKTNGPVSAEDHFILAKARVIQGDADAAIDQYAQAAALDPSSLVIAREAGLYLLQVNQKAKATAELKRAYALNYKARKPEDEQLNDALRKVGVIPGPSLAENRDLHSPIIPQGPLPELDLSKITGGSDDQASTTGQ